MVDTNTFTSTISGLSTTGASSNGKQSLELHPFQVEIMGKTEKDSITTEGQVQEAVERTCRVCVENPA